MNEAAEELKMRGTELAGAMPLAVDKVVSVREGTSALDKAIKAIVGTIGRFGGKDATSSLEAYCYGHYQIISRGENLP